jgi:predicted AAA+ superfamily ATPase
MSNDSIRERELSPLKSIDDNNAKYIISTDVGSFNYDGIKQINLIDWMLENN